MPTYQYACTACGEQLEAVQSFSDPSLSDCPACGGLLRKVYSAVGVVFKGSGFYKNDSRKSESSTKSDKPSEKKSDAASAAKTDASTSSGSGAGSSSSTPASTSSSSPASSSSTPAA